MSEAADPFRDFLEESAGARVAGYLETPVPGRPELRWVLSFRDPEATLTLRPGTDARGLAARSAELLGGRPGRALVGYLGFDAAGLFEPLLGPPPAGSPFPVGEFAVAALPSAPRRIPRRGAPRGRPPPGVPPRADSLPRGAFERGVRRLQRRIRDGEAFQVVLAHRRRFRTPEDLGARAAELRRRERYAYFFFLRFGRRTLVGASPESVVEADRGRAFVSPIAGTRGRPRPRGRAALARDPKELAEHRMLVDLARNDLGRVASPGSVRLEFRERAQRYARLEHLVSRVGARLRPEVGPWELLGATFPAGTVSGAPKIRATSLLRAEERTWRGPYGGAVGFTSQTGPQSWGLAIRSAFVDGPDLYTAAGAGIVHRSRPDREWAETLTKLAEVEACLVGETSG